MTAALKANASVTFELKSAALTLVALVLKTTELSLLAQELQARFGDAPALFDQDPVVIDLSQLRDDPGILDFNALTTLLRQHKMLPIAARGGNAAQMEAAVAAGLTDAQDSTPPAPAPREAAVPAVADNSTTEMVPKPQATAVTTLVIDKPLRSGQRIYAKGGDLVVMAVVSFGAEVIADGNIHVYGPLRGRAIAGARGNTEARIFSTCMEPELVSIAGTYRTTETALPATVLSKPAQVRLIGDKLLIEALKS
jgi:septum site-determining protein MinC